MPPGQTLPAMLSWDVAKKVCTPQDFERLACAYLNATTTVEFDAATASAQFGCKADSFKRSIWVITKKIKDYKGGDGGGDTTPAPASAKKATGRKRKAEGEEVSTKRGRKKQVRQDDDVEDVPIKSENGANGADSDDDDEGELL
ncbi:Hypothetical predicted protein [Lecanosticta acicola]|uniref:Uncharacterized protein n=1 Tax=Lecanosticta acicola TaxID=111012 RepID=A0AAI8Z1S7_9PEZI|nr:Hypothetical predicted protein [Lecanosticta acicola]